jgi:hypothetical protein
MSARRSFYRKIAYFIAIAVLLVPLSALSMPSSAGDSGQENPGGKLARLRKANGLSQANLGEIDPASETMKLATLGFRGIATNVLWHYAKEYKKHEDWTNLSTTLEQLTKLQPNFISVWQFQAWNLSYNVSVEFDDYHDRYAWVVKGINFLKQGEQYNRNEPQLLHDIGWFISQKIGMADEKKQFRRLFKDDDDFHPADRPRDERDNWLVGKQWYLKAERAVDTLGKSIGGTSPLLFYSYAPKAQMSYAEALEKDGTHGEVARNEWKQAADDWREYGDRGLLTSSGVRINLNDEERARAEAEKYEKQLAGMMQGVYEQLTAERRAALTLEQREAIDTPQDERDAQQHQLAAEAQRAMEIKPEDVAQRIERESPEKGAEARRVARLAMEAQLRADLIDRNRNTVNFEYWQTRCEFEQTPDALAARELIYQGDQALERADLLTAKDLYDQGMKHWRRVFDQFPAIRNDSTAGDELIEVIVRYRDILNEIDEPFPQNFILRDIVELHDQEGKLDGVFPTQADDEDAQAKPAEGQPPEPAEQ